MQWSFFGSGDSKFLDMVLLNFALVFYYTKALSIMTLKGSHFVRFGVETVDPWKRPPAGKGLFYTIVSKVIFLMEAVKLCAFTDIKLVFFKDKKRKNHNSLMKRDLYAQLRSETYRSLFNLPRSEKLDGDCNCSLWLPYSKCAVRGKLFVSHNFVCFDR